MTWPNLRENWRLPAPERKDASMDLLLEITREPIDPDYAVVSARPGPKQRNRLALAVVMAITGMLVSMSAVHSFRAAPVVAEQRRALIESVHEGNERVAQQRARVEELQTANDAHQKALLEGDEEASFRQEHIAELAPTAGAVDVSGPGLEIIVDDASEVRGDELDQVLDGDIQVLVNGLWRAGAEAVAINGHRITSRSAIRSAGDAITVNYRSLTRPYTITAVGSPDEFAGAFAATPEGRLWRSLRDDYAFRFDVRSRDDVVVPGDRSLTVRHARRTP